MLRHVVFFNWNEEADEPAKQAVEDRLRALPELIPEIKSYRLGPDAGLAEGNFDFALVADFDSVEGFQTYQCHPEHLQVVQEIIRPQYLGSGGRPILARQGLSPPASAHTDSSHRDRLDFSSSPNFFCVPRRHNSMKRSILWLLVSLVVAVPATATKVNVKYADADYGSWKTWAFAENPEQDAALKKAGRTEIREKVKAADCRASGGAGIRAGRGRENQTFG